MTEYLKIKNWSRWQSYRADRGQPPWIKVHRCVMRNPEWVALTDIERGQLVSIWLLAADNNGLIPSSPSLIQKLCFMSSPLKLNKFIELGFICRNDVKMTPERRQDDQPKAEQSRVEKSRVETEKKQNRFNIFYVAYPKKKNKGQAEKIFFKLNPDDNLLTIMLSTIERTKKTEGWLKDNGKYIPYPATWLNAKGWEDEDVKLNPLDGVLSEKGQATVKVLQSWMEDKKEKDDEEQKQL